MEGRARVLSSRPSSPPPGPRPSRVRCGQLSRWNRPRPRAPQRAPRVQRSGLARARRSGRKDARGKQRLRGRTTPADGGVAGRRGLRGWPVLVPPRPLGNADRLASAGEAAAWKSSSALGRKCAGVSRLLTSWHHGASFARGGSRVLLPKRGSRNFELELRAWRTPGLRHVLLRGSL